MYRTADTLSVLAHLRGPLHPQQLKRWVTAGHLTPAIDAHGRGGQRRWDRDDLVLLRCVALELDHGQISGARVRQMSRAYAHVRGGPQRGRYLVGDRMTGRWRIADGVPPSGPAVSLYDLGWLADERDAALETLGLVDLRRIA